jgi:hypothetical protein
MTENVMTAKNKVPSVRDELSSEELEAVSGGSLYSVLSGLMAATVGTLQQQQGGGEGAQGAQPGPAEQFSQLLGSIR